MELANIEFPKKKIGEELDILLKNKPLKLERIALVGALGRVLKEQGENLSECDLLIIYRGFSTKIDEILKKRGYSFHSEQYIPNSLVQDY